MHTYKTVGKTFEADVDQISTSDPKPGPSQQRGLQNHPSTTNQGPYSQRFLFLELCLFLEFFLELSFFLEKF